MGAMVVAQHTFVNPRKHPRAQLKLPARIRWHGPIGMRLETTQTVDVSRDGMLFHRNEPCDRMALSVWVAFPFELRRVAPTSTARKLRRAWCASRQDPANRMGTGSPCKFEHGARARS